MSTVDAQRIAELEQENRDLGRTNEILKAASAFYGMLARILARYRCSTTSRRRRSGTLTCGIPTTRAGPAPGARYPCRCPAASHRIRRWPTATSVHRRGWYGRCRGRRARRSGERGGLWCGVCVPGFGVRAGYRDPADEAITEALRLVGEQVH